jgi:hypothetical protein
MIQPTIGRVIWFYSIAHGCPDVINPQPYPAFVCYVHGDRMINVAGFDSTGVPFARSSVTLLQDDDTIPLYRDYCTWMPYQVGQAKKAE